MIDAMIERKRPTVDRREAGGSAGAENRPPPGRKEIFTIGP